MSAIRNMAGLLLLAVLSGCASLPPAAQDDWWGRDKAQHFIAGAVLGGGAAAIGHAAGWSDAESGCAAVGVVVAAGAAKEYYDVRVSQTGWSWKDQVWNMIGCVAGASLAMSLE